MQAPTFASWLALNLALQASIAATIPDRSSVVTSPNLPLLIWHGLGDAYDSEGIKSVGELYEKIYPKSPVYIVHLGENGGDDRHASFFGNLTEQVAQVCDEMRADKVLSRAPGANALGFSQGGVFLRGLIERCDSLKVRNLVTFGSPHSGITEFAKCGDDDWWCKIWSGTLKSNTWSSFAQSTLVPAQYYRTSEDLDNFLEHSNFLADINNERKQKADVYKARIAALERFVMIKFQEEDVIQPPESSWFADKNTTSGLLTRLKERDLYKEDWLGLRRLDEAGGIIFRTTPGKHMQIQDGALEDAFRRYFAPATSSWTTADWLEDGVASVEATQAVLHLDDPTQSHMGSSDVDKPSSSSNVFLHRYAKELADIFG